MRRGIGAASTTRTTLGLNQPIVVSIPVFSNAVVAEATIFTVAYPRSTPEEQWLAGLDFVYGGSWSK